MGTCAVISKPAVRPHRGALLDGPVHQLQDGRTVPVLSGDSCGVSEGSQNGRCDDNSLYDHCRAISRRAALAASTGLLLFAAACDDLTQPEGELLTTGELLVLPQQAAAPAVDPVSFWVYNRRPIARQLVHVGGFNIPYLEVSFPAQALVSLSGQALSDDDSVLVTVQPRAGEYGFTLSPANLLFDESRSPTATFFFGIYADASVWDASASYGSASEYVAALDIWFEITVDRWSIAPASGPAGNDAVAAALQSSGEYLLAAPR